MVFFKKPSQLNDYAREVKFSGHAGESVWRKLRTNVTKRKLSGGQNQQFAGKKKIGKKIVEVRMLS